MKNKRRINLTLTYILLIILSIVWLFPIVWVVLTSFRGETGAYVPYIIPKSFTLDNYVKLFNNSSFPFAQWFWNTLIVATATTIVSTFITVAMAYSLSRIKFKHRNGFLKLALVLNMFPGFMSMIAVYYILKAFNLTQTLFALVLVYSAGAALGFYIAKGFFDTIPYSLDESAMIDGATRKDIFFKITLPLSKPIIVYTALTAFIGPWIDFIFAKVILGCVVIFFFDLYITQHLPISRVFRAEVQCGFEMLGGIRITAGFFEPGSGNHMPFTLIRPYF